MARLIKNENDRERAMTGFYGERWLTGTSVAGEYFAAFYVIEDAVVGWTNDTEYGDSAQVARTIPAGTVIVGYMTTIVVTSGVVLAKIG